MPAPRRRPPVFISHSSRGDADAASVLSAIRRALKAARFEPLVDERGLKGGDDWRLRLHTWMSHCDAAILLLSRQALESDWVLQEATILTARRVVQGLDHTVETFLLLPVLVGITMKDVSAHPAFAELDLPSIQALRSGTPGQLAREVVRLLQPFSRRASSRRNPRQSLRTRSRATFAKRVRVFFAMLSRSSAIRRRAGFPARTPPRSSPRGYSSLIATGF